MKKKEVVDLDDPKIIDAALGALFRVMIRIEIVDLMDKFVDAKLRKFFYSRFPKGKV